MEVLPHALRDQRRMYCLRRLRLRIALSVAISEGDGKYVIDPDTCIDCGACAGTCPVGAPQEG